MKCILALFLFIIILPTYGCSTPSYLVITDASNYREKLTITRSSLTFYNGEYIGSEKNCFPPIENRICEDQEGEEVYKAGKKLKMERINIKIKDTSSINTKVVKDMAYLTAAELTEQLGYKTFTVTDIIENNSCGVPMYSVDTYGHRAGDTYYGSSQLNERTICSSQFSISVLLYDDQEEFKLGVLSLRTGQNRLGPKRSLLSPYKDLYSGTSPGLYEENLKRELVKRQPHRVQARNLFCYWAVRELGISATTLARRFGLTQPAVSVSVGRGERFVAEKGWLLEELVRRQEVVSASNL